jgi:hypothetical protein
MKVPKEARALLRKRKLARFRWPLETAPRAQGVYALGGTGTSAADEHFKVIAVAREKDGFSVAALIVDDPVRLMPKNVGDYESDPGMLATFGEDLNLVQHNPRVYRGGEEPEPEAVDDETQRRFSRAGRMKRASAREQVADELAEIRTRLDALRRENPEAGRGMPGKKLHSAIGLLDVAHQRLRQGAAVESRESAA